MTTKTRPLHDIVEEMLLILEASEGEVTPALDAVAEEFERKCEAYTHVIRRVEAESKAFLAMEKQLSEYYLGKATARANTGAVLRERLKQSLLTTGVSKLKCPTTTVWLQETTKLDLPPDWAERHWPSSPYVKVREDRQPDKAAISAALERGEAVPDAKLVTNKHVRWS